MTQPAFKAHPDSMSEGTGQKYGTEHVARWYGGLTCAMGSGMGSSRVMSSHL